MILPIYAHAIVIPVALPIPLELHLVSSGVVVAVSYLISIWASRVGFRLTGQDFLCVGLSSLSTRVVELVVRGASFVGTTTLFLLIGAAFFGVEDSLDNIAPTFLWVIAWVGISLVSITIGNVWSALNPWRLIHVIISGIIPRGFSGISQYSRGQTLERLKMWPACFIFVCFAWLELIYPDSISPRHLGVILAGYSGFTIVGIRIFGPARWLGQVEIFSVVFKILSQFAPIHIGSRLLGPEETSQTAPTGRQESGNVRNCGRPSQKAQLTLRPVWKQLVHKRNLTVSEVVLIVLMLATMTVDGFLSTPTWAMGQTRMADVGIPVLVIDSVVLIGGAVIFVSAYWLVVYAMKAFAKSNFALIHIGGLFAYSLIPIIAGYFIAHYLHLLLIQGQLVIPLLSDPFGLGWNIFGTRYFRVDIALLGAEAYWAIAVVAIVTGHVLSVVISHSVAIREFGSQGAAARGSGPMIILMIGYTVGSLWILAQPIIG